jgi:hypothetical protein
MDTNTKPDMVDLFRDDDNGQRTFETGLSDSAIKDLHK